MKKRILFRPILLAGFIMVIFASCKKDKDAATPSDTTNEKLTLQQFQENLSGKWNVTTDSSPIAKEASSFVSFEFFSEDNKYIANVSDMIYFGTYSINSTLDTLTLPDLGTIAVGTMDATNFNFSLKLNGESAFTPVFTMFEEPSIPSSPATDLLCKKMWTINWQYTNVPGSDTTYFDDRNWVTSMKIYFSRNGTYFLRTEIEGGANTNTVKSWGWQDANETIILSGMDKASLLKPAFVMKLTDTEWKYKFESSGDTIYASASR